MANLKASIQKRESLTESEIAGMCQLYLDYYEGSSLNLFTSDLAEKTHVIMLYSDTKMCGFSTLSLMDLDRGAGKKPEQYRALFSGDTIIHHDHWGEQALAEAFCTFAGQVKAQKPQTPLYWLLISKGYRTYRYLHLFSKDYWPSYRTNTSVELKYLLDELANKKFGEFYDPSTGLIQFPNSRGHLRENWANIRDNMLERPEVKFFLQSNPLYAEGVELACFTLLEKDNLRSIARRAFIAGEVSASDPLMFSGSANVA